MKAITIRQPWAQLIAIGAKRYETRSYAADYRGKIAVHAGTKAGTKPVFPWLPQEIAEEIRLKMIKALGSLRKLPLGAIIATAELVECREIWNGRMADYPGGVVCIDQPNQY
jgi:hypothetical protein